MEAGLPSLFSLPLKKSHLFPFSRYIDGRTAYSKWNSENLVPGTNLDEVGAWDRRKIRLSVSNFQEA